MKDNICYVKDVADEPCEHLFEKTKTPEKKFSKYHGKEIYFHAKRCIRCGKIILGSDCLLSENGKHDFTEWTKNDNGIPVKFRKCACGRYEQYPINET